MRTAFVESLCAIAAEDERVMLLTGDLGFMVLEPFADRFPDRFVNVGVAEQNMLAVAAGLAQQGFEPYCYSIATFATMRCYEHFRDGAVLHGLRVRLVGVGGGFGYGTAGPTHWALEDVGIMRMQRVLVAAPGSDEQVDATLRAVHASAGPCYLRLAKDSVSNPQLRGRFTPGHLEVLQEGCDVALVTTGGMTGATLQANELLRAQRCTPTVAQVPCLSPAPTGALSDIASSHAVMLTVEDHCRTGGLGSLAAEAIAERGAACRLIRLGADDALTSPPGDESWLRARHGLAPEAIAQTALASLPHLSPA